MHYYYNGTSPLLHFKVEGHYVINVLVSVAKVTGGMADTGLTEFTS